MNHSTTALNPRVSQIAVLGIDGSGKSTVSRHLGRMLSITGPVCRISDAIEVFRAGQVSEHPQPGVERLRHWFHNQAKRAGSMKRYKIPKLAELFLRDHLVGRMTRRYDPVRVVMDGSPLLNMLAWADLYHEPRLSRELGSRAIGVLTGREIPPDSHDPIFEALPELVVAKRLGLTHLSLPDICLFLDLDPEEACRRIDTRGEATQIHETRETLGRLREAYLRVCEIAAEDWSVHVIPVDVNHDEMAVLTAIGDLEPALLDDTLQPPPHPAS